MFDNIQGMPSWSDFAGDAPRLAIEIHSLLHQYGQGFAYLATVRADGGPRVHPVSPVIAEGGLFCFLVPSPKRTDLLRDGRYALHSFPGEHSDDEAYLTGRASLVSSAWRRDRVASAARADVQGSWLLFELDVEVAAVTHHVGLRRTPSHHVWHAPSAATPAAEEAIAVYA